MSAAQGRKLQLDTSGADASAVRRPQRGTITKAKIMKVASALFQERGYDRASLEEIARSLHISKPSLYHHFRNKEDILLECIRSGYAALETELEKRDDASLSGIERVRILLETYAATVMRDYSLTMVIADVRVMSPDAKRDYDGYRRLLNNALELRVKQGIEDQSIRVSDARITTHTLFSMVNGLAQPILGDKLSLDAVIDTFLSIVFDGIGRRA